MTMTRLNRLSNPASHFFEFKGAKAPKSKFKFTFHDEPWFCFAGLWTPGTPEKGEAFYSTYDSTRTGRGRDTFSTDGRAEARRLAKLARPFQA